MRTLRLTRLAVLLVGVALAAWVAGQALAASGFGQPGGLRVLPDHRTGVELVEPFAVDGVALVGAHHPVSPASSPGCPNTPTSTGSSCATRPARRTSPASPTNRGTTATSASSTRPHSVRGPT